MNGDGLRVAGFRLSMSGRCGVFTRDDDLYNGRSQGSNASRTSPRLMEPLQCPINILDMRSIIIIINASFRDSFLCLSPCITHDAAP